MLAKTSKYGPGATVIANTVGSMSIAWFSQLNNIEKRLGDLRLNAEMIFPVRPVATTSDPDDIYAEPVPAKKERANVIPGARPPHPAGIWTRAYGQHVKADLGIAGMSSFSEEQYGLDVGVDREFIYSRRNILYAGGFAGYQGARRDFKNGYGSKGDTDSLAFGIYGAWLHADGFFLEADAKGQYYMSQYDALGDHADYNTWGAGVSFRFGYHLRFAQSFFLEPVLAFSYVHIFGEDFSTDNGLRVNVRDSDIRAAAASVRLGKAIEMGSHGVFQPYVKAGIEEQASDAGSVRIGILKLTPNTDGTRGVFGLGGAWQVNVRQQIYFDYEYVWGDKYEKPWAVSLGYRHLF
jgi:outer membrane autotransporter protein